MTTIALYATDTMADWEYGYLTAGLAMAREQDPDANRLIVASETGDVVTTMGGLRITPDVGLADLPALDALILPGADSWDSGHDAVLRLAVELVAAGTPVAAICGATLGMARAGLLDDRPHTSNAPEFLTQATEYHGSEYYRDEKAVSDGTVITAGGVSPLEFAKLVFERLNVFPQPVVDAWYGLYTTGERKYYDQLAGA
ncbi:MULTISPECIES: DJ-1/PfpI family protein [unclassified Rhodococcus (in: high G+C Gram-positive bacteria)]|uniref:DJ-1/PfpI family protein n=1 Tax=unclassified Rhodococcus (in: high G+C Gram-positive bacteria) TaxID=192944 RepID=UPI0011EC0437|nr:MULTISPECIES: DJ-1/PfpI family protein [unclassified Rhodococcus (in: high G+C Gram-positive bacteria)]KAA0924958.1 thiamine biosynthesis protein ThiJ [Rhodococcus sp. ANT_H53B]MDI9927768.1 DJ-1/PfpI family protein [Rhodococcus sp. IEGM 1341]